MAGPISSTTPFLKRRNDRKEVPVRSIRAATTPSLQQAQRVTGKSLPRAPAIDHPTTTTEQTNKE